jgi:threonine dehydrogenase-like Zn-dependent dehydrogenase
MRAVAVAPARREIGVIERPEPSPGRGEVLLRTLEVGVCGTDREIATFEFGTPPPGDDVLVIGHESLAEVAEVGPDVSGIAPGELVVPIVRRPCGLPRCRPCAAGRQDFCVTGAYRERGIKEAHGFMAEWFSEEPRFLRSVPAELRDCAVLVEPLTIAEKALSQVWDIQRRLPWVDPEAPRERRGEGLRAVVLGAGPVGLLGAMALRGAGFAVTVGARSPAPNPSAAVAEAIGADYVALPEVPAEELGRIDVVYEAAGAAAPAFELLAQLSENGIFAFTGVPGRGGRLELDADRLMSRLVLGNQVVFGTVNAPSEAFAQAIDDLGRFERLWPGAVTDLISGRHPMEDAPALLRERGSGIKHVVAVG